MNRIPGRLALLLSCLVASLAWTASAAAQQLEIEHFSAKAVDENGAEVTQAGAHPFAYETAIRFGETIGGPWNSPMPTVNFRDTVIDLPHGLVGDPTAVPKCDPQLLVVRRGGPQERGYGCPRATQIGLVELLRAGPLDPANRWFEPIFNMEPTLALPAQFGFAPSGIPVYLNASIRPDNGLRIAVGETSQSLAIVGARVTIWGVPADPAHDMERGYVGFHGGVGICDFRTMRELPCEAGIEPLPFLSNPADCSAGPPTVGVRVNSWQERDRWVTASSTAGSPITGCEKLRFEPSMDVLNTTRTPDAPTGLEVGLGFPQTDLNPNDLATPPLRDAKVTLPEGISISPSAADGLEGCSDEQIAVGVEAPVTCPAASKIGTVTVDTPVLDDPVEGSVYAGSQKSDDPTSGEMYRLFIALVDPDRGLNVKLPGKVVADPATGQLTATFANNPQLPVAKIDLRLKDGPRAPLANPLACGPKPASGSFVAWSGHAVGRTDVLSVDCSGASGFAPSFNAGTLDPTGGEFAPFALRLDRPDRERYLSGVGVDLPAGLLAKLKGVALCPEAVAGDGTPGLCPQGSRVGTATVAAGPGSSPLYLKGDMFLTGPYKGGPYGLAIHVRAKAGPFDLGWVKVRDALHVDSETAQVSVASDPLPQIVKGVPVRLRSVNVDVDRPEFTVNPTSCDEQRVEAVLTPDVGAAHRAGSRFRVGDCQALAFRPKLAMRLTGRKQTRTGGHPSLRAVLSQGEGQANIGKAQVTMPKSIALDAVNSYDPKLVCDYDASLKADCPASTVIGSAVASTPLLDRPLSGKVHLVQGIKFGAKGNRIRTTPSLLVKLRGQVDINLRARTSVRDDRLVTTFPSVPDARVSRFAMTVKGGKKGILVVTRTRRAKIDICNGRQTAAAEIDGHNGKRADFSVAVKAPCSVKAAGPKRKRR